MMGGYVLQALTWWRHLVWLREPTPLWRVFQWSLLSSALFPATPSTETYSWPKAQGEFLQTFPKCKSAMQMMFCIVQIIVFFFLWLILQLYPSSRLFSRAHNQFGLPPAARLAQGALCSLAAHWQRFPAQNGSGAGPWVQGCMKRYGCMLQKWWKHPNLWEWSTFSCVSSYCNITQTWK